MEETCAKEQYEQELIQVINGVNPAARYVQMNRIEKKKKLDSPMSKQNLAKGHWTYAHSSGL